MAAAGWYPDPGGQPGMYRHFDGVRWTPHLSANPSAPAPRVGRGGPPTVTARPAASSPRGAWWMVAAVLAGVLVIAVIAVIIGSERVRQAPLPDDPLPSAAPGTGCPEATIGQESPSPVTGGRVISGALSYPALGAPFSAPIWDTRVPFGRAVRSQNAVVEAGGDGVPTWVASALIARLTAGDGFYDPERGAARVADCVVSKFYGDTRIERADRRNEATEVDGRAAWLIESHLTFDLPGIQTTGETMIIVVIDGGVSESGLFYGSIPDSSPQFDGPIRGALSALRVDA